MASNETVADIVIDLRGEPLAENGAKPWLHYLADRIEAAHEREIAERDKAVAEAEEQLELEHAGYIETGAIAGFREQLRQRDAEIERLEADCIRCRDELRATRERRDVCETKMRTALERVTRAESKCGSLRELVKELANELDLKTCHTVCDLYCTKDDQKDCEDLENRALVAKAMEVIGGGK